MIREASNLFFSLDRKITILITSLANLKTRIIYDVPRVCTVKKSIFVSSKSSGDPIVLYFYGKDLFEFRVRGATATENSNENILYYSNYLIHFFAI